MPSIDFPDTNLLRQLAGDSCAHLKIIEDNTGARCSLKGTTIEFSGEKHEVELARHVLNDLYKLLQEGLPLYPSDIFYAVRMLSKNRNLDLKDVFLDSIYISSSKKVITPKSLQQKLYIDSIRENDIVFGIGPAGTGKTYLAMAMAITFLLKKKVERIILTRPAGESIPETSV
jgi:phosphate starvation-inducible PhoH-like protein